jgi:SHS2 domain-containing protein
MQSKKNSKLTTKWKEIEHTADVGIIAYGKTLEELFENAAFGMLSISYGNLSIKSNFSLKIDIEEPDETHLLVAWLSELNYLTLTNDFLTHSINDLKITQSKESWRLQVEISGTQAGTFLDFFNTEIKAVTYHKLKIQKKKNHFECQVIFDI